MPIQDVPNNRGTALFVTQVVVLFLALVAMSLRIYVKTRMLKSITQDDWWMFIATLGYTMSSAVSFWGVSHGASGKLLETSTPKEIVIGLQAWYVCELFYAPVSAMIRTSVGLFLLRITTNRTHKVIIYIAIIALWIVSLIFFFVVIFQCYPVNYFWGQVYGVKGKCMDYRVVPDITILQSVVCAACDFAFATLPIAMLWNVQLNKRTKAVIAVLLSMGFFGGVALLVRIPYIQFLAISPEFLYETIDVGIWSVIEPSLGIIAGCIATLRPLFSKWKFGYKQSNIRASSKKSGDSSWSWPRSSNSRRIDSKDDYHYDPQNRGKTDFVVPEQRDTRSLIQPRLPDIVQMHDMDIGRADADNMELNTCFPLSSSFLRSQTPPELSTGVYTDIEALPPQWPEDEEREHGILQRPPYTRAASSALTRNTAAPDADAIRVQTSINSRSYQRHPVSREESRSRNMPGVHYGSQYEAEGVHGAIFDGVERERGIRDGGWGSSLAK